MDSRLDELFDSGALVRHSPTQPNLIHLVRALATIGGVPELDGTPLTRQIIDLIGPAEHLIFVLLDGLGMNLVRKLPPETFLARHLKTQLHATSPSTTACA